VALARWAADDQVNSSNAATKFPLRVRHTAAQPAVNLCFDRGGDGVFWSEVVTVDIDGRPVDIRCQHEALRDS
jgi:hypothetical protein